MCFHFATASTSYTKYSFLVKSKAWYACWCYFYRKIIILHKYNVSSHRVRILIHPICILLFFQIVRGIFHKEQIKTWRYLASSEYRHIFKSLTSSTDWKLLGECDKCTITKRKKRLLQKKFNRLRKNSPKLRKNWRVQQTEHVFYYYWEKFELFIRTKSHTFAVYINNFIANKATVFEKLKKSLEKPELEYFASFYKTCGLSKVQRSWKTFIWVKTSISLL